MSDTPRTDSIYDPELLDRCINEHGRSWGWGTVADFRNLCRQLERELAALEAYAARLEAAGDAMAETSTTPEIERWREVKELKP